ncbi:hypothetical protein HJC99_00275 [Candidatus Saccharibacteria bacterium]|nr:hypothetical protein [Candidatus Saccharibacteria bacterium]
MPDSPVGVVFVVTNYEGEVHAASEASESGWFRNLPSEMHPNQDNYLVEKDWIAR